MLVRNSYTPLEQGNHYRLHEPSSRQVYATKTYRSCVALQETTTLLGVLRKQLSLIELGNDYLSSSFLSVRLSYTPIFEKAHGWQ
jgi:hypothetical protein